MEFSEGSRKALAWSARFANEVGARLTVLHVLDTAFLSIGNLVSSPDIFSELRRRATESYGLWRKQLGIQAPLEIAEGVPADVIVNAASERGEDLVVMGTHGLSGFERFFLGSVTEKVLHRVRVPLLTLSDSPTAASGADGSWMKGPSGSKRILAAIDLGPDSQAVVRHAVWLAEHYRAQLVALHVVSQPYLPLNEASFEPLESELRRITGCLVEEREKKIQALLPESMDAPVETVVNVGSTFETLRDAVEERGVELVVMGSGNHGEAAFRWLGSTCHKMVRSATCPVLVVR